MTHPAAPFFWAMFTAWGAVTLGGLLTIGYIIWMERDNG
jgi:hypothetical protein